MSVLAQIIAYVISPLATLLAVWVAYLALLRRSQPQILVYYEPNSNAQSFINLVIENIGGATAMEVTFSDPVPVNCFGIEKPDGPGSAIASSGFPAISPAQRYVYYGGQYAGLASRIGKGLPLTVAYKYKNPFGFTRKRSQYVVLSLVHMEYMPTRTSAEQAIVDALKGPDTTTLQELRNELHAINQSLYLLVKQSDRGAAGNDA